ncbi:hypothetical protein [Vibrio cyclitrophicus]|uniref:hypothetical protein n=1 Tax=Vibrio cyclitrophicus TaxID=47951 RepID=UPI00148CC36F|nr:hypothetical protein [Vibrio cyclitrophicus]NOH19477.1 hypothetical protein [Vibrio cyclitrophicus]
MEYRPEIIIHINDKKTDVVKPELTVLKFNIDNSYKTVDVGSWCYSRKGAVRSHPHKSLPIEKNSIVQERIPYVERIIEGLRGSPLRQASVYATASAFGKFIKFVDGRGLSLSSDDAWIKSVYAYYEYLVLRSRLPSGAEGSLKERSAAVELLIVKKALAWALELSDNAVDLNIPRIKDVKTISLPRDELERNQFVQILLAIFERFSDVLINNRTFPFVLNLSHWGVGEHVFSRASQLRKKSVTDSFVNKDASIVPRDEVRARYKDWRECIGVMSIYDKWIQRLSVTNTVSSDLQRRSIFNYAMYCYYLAFIGIVGTNNAVTSTLRLQNAEKSLPTNKHAPRGYVFTGLKIRAGNKTVYPTMGKEFYQFHKKYEELRQWGENEFSLKDNSLGFYRISGVGSCGLLNKTSLETLKVWLLGHFPSTQWFTARELRKGVSWSFWNLADGDINTVSLKLQNDLSTTIKSYLSPPKVLGLKELSTFMNSMWDTAIQSSRSAKHIPVSINGGAHKTPAGHCNAIDNSAAKLMDGFTESAPSPTCTRSETCFFCKYYVLHADEEDIHQILSLRELLPHAQKRALSEVAYAIKFAPVLHRIEEILEGLIEKNPDKKALIDEVSDKVKRGELSQHWQSHFDLLADLEEYS